MNETKSKKKINSVLSAILRSHQKKKERRKEESSVLLIRKVWFRWKEGARLLHPSARSSHVVVVGQLGGPVTPSAAVRTDRCFHCCNRVCCWKLMCLAGKRATKALRVTRWVLLISFCPYCYSFQNWKLCNIPLGTLLHSIPVIVAPLQPGTWCRMTGFNCYANCSYLHFVCVNWPRQPFPLL